jgi:hypothetical protein
MTLRLYLFGLFATAAISLGLWFLLFLGVNPNQAPVWIIILFYVTMQLFLTAVFAIVLFYVKVWLSNREVIFSHLMPTLRQSFFIGLIFTGMIFFQQVKVLNWWVAGMFICAIGLIELFFRSKKTFGGKI